MTPDTDELSRIIEQQNPVLRLQRQCSVWRRIQESGVCKNEGTATFSRYVEKHLQQSADVLVRWSQEPPPRMFDPQLVIDAHRESFAGLHPWAGTLRKTEMVFGRFSATSHVHVAMGLAVMARLVQQLPQTTPYQQLYKIGAFHVAMIGLHPFLDGNGRSTRTVMAHQLAQFGHNPAIAFNYIHANKHEYLHANNQGLETNNPKALADLLANVYGIKSERLAPLDFRLRYYPASYEPKPISEDSIRRECEQQSRPLAVCDHRNSGQAGPDLQFGY